MNPFFVTGLPRSRTAWLANLLTWGPAFCFHEGMTQCRSVTALKALLESVPSPYVGDSDPSLGLFSQAVIQEFPGARMVFIRRPMEAALDSMFAACCEDGHDMFGDITPAALKEQFVLADAGLDRLWASLPYDRRMMVVYNDLDREQTIRAIWRFCLPKVEFPLLRYQMLDSLRITQVFSKVLKRHPAVHYEGLLARETTV